MKRMSEVFELPVSSRAFGSVYAVSIAPGVHITTASTYAAHAINHVDALADALEFLLNLPRGSSGRIIIEKSEELAVLEVLRAYRGAK